MSIAYKFNHHPGKRRPSKVNDATHTEDGTPLYSCKKTAGTEKAVEVMKQWGRRPDGSMLKPPPLRIVR